MKYADASVVIPFEFIRLPITAIAAFIFLMRSGVWALAGAAIIFLWHLATSEKRRAKIGSEKLSETHKRHGVSFIGLIGTN